MSLHTCGNCGGLWVDHSESFAGTPCMCGDRRVELLCALKLNEFDLVRHLERQKDFSLRTFGPGHRTKGVCDHIKKELVEIEKDPLDLEEWIDVILLALDGAWRTGASTEEIVNKLDFKQTKNENRKWPDWRTMNPDEAIQHVKESKGACGRIMVGCGTDFYDPLCTLEKGHKGVCLSTSAIANYHTEIDFTQPAQESIEHQQV